MKTRLMGKLKRARKNRSRKKRENERRVDDD